MTERASVRFEVDSDAKEAAMARLEHGELSEILQHKVHELAFGEEVSERERLGKNLEQKRDRRDQLRAEIRELQAELETVETAIARMEERRDGMARREDRYEAALEMLEDTLYDGGRVFTTHGQVVKAAKMGGVEPKEVIRQLKGRNPEIPDHAFVDGVNDRRRWTGLPKDRRD